jgi:hypothetical protein
LFDAVWLTLTGFDLTEDVYPPAMEQSKELFILFSGKLGIEYPDAV